MRQTFFFIPPSWIDPILWIWVLVGTGVLIYIAAKKGIASDFWGSLPVFVVVAVILKFVIPQVMVKDPDTGENLGLAIRGYGFFLLLGVLTGVGLVMYRSRQLGLNPDAILNLCFWIFVTGIAGARLFYVIQYWPQFQDNGTPSIAKIINMTEGGLVVYGSIIGGAIGAAIFLAKKKMPILPVLDILAPCIMIGLSIGRIGCLMNGCCWGGICDESNFSIQFPEGSPPYARHVETGELFGMKARPMREKDILSGREILDIEPDGPADRAGIQVGDKIMGYNYNPNPNDAETPEQIIYHIDGPNGLSKYVFDSEQIPVVSRPVHPSQVYSSINAFLVFLFLWFYFPSRQRDGQVLGLLMVIYPVGRFLLEIIRSDEMGQFGTSFTISQLTSIGSIMGGASLMVYGFFCLKRTETFVLPGKNPVSG